MTTGVIARLRVVFAAALDLDPAVDVTACATGRSPAGTRSAT